MAKGKVSRNTMSMTFGRGGVSEKIVAYIDREGVEITCAKWTTLRGNKNYYFVRRYEGEKFYIDIEWLGKITNASVNPRQYWKSFVVRVGNIIITGDRPGTFAKKKVEDPQLTKTFTTEKDAMAYYQSVLKEKGLLTVEETYEGDEIIIEVGNLIEQPALTETLVTSVKDVKNVARVASNFGDW